MSPTRFVACLLVGGWLIWLAAAARADVNYQPYEFSDYVGDARWFQHWDGYPFDENPKGSRGFFFSWNFTKMLMQSAEPTAVGAEGIVRLSANGVIGITREYNTLDTGSYSDAWHDGNDTVFGYMDKEHGWSFRWFDLNARDLELVRSNAQVVFNDPDELLVGFYDLDGDGLDDSFDGDLDFGRDTPGGGIIDVGDLVQQGVIYDEIHARQATRLWAVELNYVTRLDREICGAYWEPFCGFRFMLFDESFEVEGLGGVLADSFWNTVIENRIVGPQVGIRWFRTDGRWTFDWISRAMCAFNFQSVHQIVGHGSRLAQIVGQQEVRGTDQAEERSQLIRSRFDRFRQREQVNNEHEMEIAPIVELSGRAIFHITRKFNFELGARAMYLDGIARPSAMVDYTFPWMGLNMSNNHQRVLLFGGFVGFNVNR